jgi:hypothetical protein
MHTDLGNHQRFDRLNRFTTIDSQSKKKCNYEKRNFNLILLCTHNV